MEKVYPHGSEKSFCKSLHAEKTLDTPDGQEWLLKVIQQCNRFHADCTPIQLVILDSLKTLTDDGENKKNWGIFFRFLDRMRKERNISFIIIQHENKTGQIYGTNDQKIKINGEFLLTRNVYNVTPTDPCNNFKTPKKYPEFLQSKLLEWCAEHPDDICFFVIPLKGRSMRPQDKRPVMLHFLPEDKQPDWHCIDFLAPDHPWSLHAFQKADVYAKTTQSMPCKENKSSENIDSIPSYNTLLTMPRASVVEWLKKANAQNGKSREAWGQYFGVHKDQIDYLMRKKELQKNDLDTLE